MPADVSILLKQDDDGDRNIDNEAVVIGGTAYYRQKILIASDYETLFDYDTRTDGNPVYIGRAEPGTAQSTASWEVQKFTYDSSSRPTRIQSQRQIAWTARTSGW